MKGRLTDLIKSGKLFKDIGLQKMNPIDDRAMICGKCRNVKRYARSLRFHEF